MNPLPLRNALLARLLRWLTIAWLGLLVGLTLALPAHATVVRGGTALGSAGWNLFNWDFAAGAAVPAGVRGGDLLIAVVGTDSSLNDYIAPPAGWTLVRETTQNDQCPGFFMFTCMRLATYVRVADWDEAGRGYHWAVGSGLSQGSQTVAITAYRGIDSTNLGSMLDNANAAFVSNKGWSSSVTTGSTTATANAGLALFVANSSSNNVLFGPASGSPGSVRFSDSFRCTSWLCGDGNSTSIYDVIEPSAGTIGNYSILASALSVWNTQLMVFKRSSIDLALTLTRLTPNLVVGQTVIYTADVKNVGTQSEGGPVTIQFTLPAGLSYTSSSGTGWSCNSSNAPTILCSRSGALAGGASTSQLTLTTTASTTGTKTLNGYVFGLGGDATLANNDAVDVLQVPDHYRLSYPTDLVACDVSTIKVTACADATCATKLTTLNGRTATLSASSGTLGSGTLTFDATGEATTTWRDPGAVDNAAVTLTLGGEQVVASNPRRCCPNGTSCAAKTGCDDPRARAVGFSIASAVNGAATDIADRIAGTGAASYVLRAVRSDKVTKACVPALSGNQTVNWSWFCKNPGTCASTVAMTITGTASQTVAGSNTSPAGTTAAVGVPMFFDANGNAPFSFDIPDVGLFYLKATRPADATVLAPLSVTSNDFAFKPAKVRITEVRCSSLASDACKVASPGLNPGAATATGAAFVPAGRSFTVALEALDASTPSPRRMPSFGFETGHTTSLNAQLVAAGGSTMPSLATTAAFSYPARDGTGSGQFSWPEVGVISIAPSVDYLGKGVVPTDPAVTVGRFIPNHFDATLTTACPSTPSFSYSGAPMQVSATPRAFGGALIQNYRGAFAKSPETRDADAVNDGVWSNAVAGSVTSSTVTWNPVYTMATTPALTAARDLRVQVRDADGVTSPTATAMTTSMRIGRLRLASAFGRRNAALSMDVVAETWHGAWRVNTLDNCTSLPAGAVALRNPRDANGVPSLAVTTPSSIATLNRGRGTLTLSTPIPGNATVSYDVGLNLGTALNSGSCPMQYTTVAGGGIPWLRSRHGSCTTSWQSDPSARATFGITPPENQRVIHVRDVF